MTYAKKPKPANFTDVGQLTASLLAPMLKKRVGINIELISHWTEIVGRDIADQCQPVKIIWPKRISEFDDFKPACLVIACDGFAALKLSHQSAEFISRINAFFGYKAIDRIKIKQQPVSQPVQSLPSLKPVISKELNRKIGEMTKDIDDSALRRSLQELAECVMAKTWEPI